MYTVTARTDSTNITNTVTVIRATGARFVACGRGAGLDLGIGCCRCIGSGLAGTAGCGAVGAAAKGAGRTGKLVVWMAGAIGRGGKVEAMAGFLGAATSMTGLVGVLGFISIFDTL